MIDLKGMIKKYGDISLPSSIAVLSNLKNTMHLLSLDVLLKQMDDANIEKSVLYAVEAPIVYASNEYVYNLCSKYPDRLIGFASVDPHSENALETLETAIKDFGFKGLKLHPPLQNFFPNDPIMFPIYQKAVELNIPIVFHVGTTPFANLCRLDQASPLLLDHVAIKFPKLKIMLTHLGTLWHNEAFMVVEKHPNVFIDTAAYVYEIKQILTSDLVSRIGANKIVFGTDYPMPYANKVHQMKDFVDCIKALDLNKKTIADIFSNNFNAFMNKVDIFNDNIKATDML